MNDQQKILLKFDQQIEVGHKSNKLKKIAPDIFELPGKTQTKIAIMASTHGNEPIGVALFSMFLEELYSKQIEPRNTLLLVLANRDAYIRHERFCEQDLNRQYHLNGTSLEGQRATIIAEQLNECDVCLDIHQTVEATTHPFWFLHLINKTGELANYLAPNLPAVVHSFDDKVTTSSSFMASKNKIGFTLEVGDSGFKPEALNLGISVIRKISLWVPGIEGEEQPKCFENKFHKTFSGGEVVKWAKGLQNFQYVEKGQVLGTLDGIDIVSEFSGYILLYPEVMFRREPKPGGLYMIVSPFDA